MPTISGIKNKLKSVIDHAYEELQVEMEDSLYNGYVIAQELWLNKIRFVSDRETREQAERRTISGVLSDINHSNCSTCDNLRSAL